MIRKRRRLDFQETDTPRNFFEMKMVKKLDKPSITQDDVETFCAYCENLVTIFNHFEYLYEKNEHKLGLLRRNGEWFFSTLERVLISAMILEAYKITDIALTIKRKESVANLTTNFFTEYNDITDKDQQDLLKSLNNEMNQFRKKIVESRNKRIAHLDRITAVDDVNLGEFTRKEYGIFVSNLEKFVNIIHQHYLNEPTVINHPSQARKLIEALERAEKYDKQVS